MKVLVLFDVAQPVAAGTEFTPESLKEQGSPTEADVLASLGRLGHTIELLAVCSNVAAIVEKLSSSQPDVIFNLSESFHHNRFHEPHIAALLELMKVRYTGSGPQSLLLCKDKVLAKKVLSYHKVRHPHFVVSRLARPLRRLRRFRYPALVKPVGEESSDGISKASFVRAENEVLERVEFLHQKFRCDVLIEEYIDGRELYLSVLGSQRLTILPPREIFFEDVPEEAPKFATFQVKWNERYRKKWGIKDGAAGPMPEGVQKELKLLARKAYRALAIRGFGRIDVRLTPRGEAYVIEVNANPCLAQDECLAQSATEAGIGYDALIQQILNCAMA